MVSARSVYKTIVGTLTGTPEAVSQHGIWEDDIAKELPIYKLTDQTADGSVLGVVIDEVLARRVDDAICIRLHLCRRLHPQRTVASFLLVGEDEQLSSGCR